MMVQQKLQLSNNLLTNDSTGLQLKYISVLSLVERFYLAIVLIAVDVFAADF